MKRLLWEIKPIASKILKKIYKNSRKFCIRKSWQSNEYFDISWKTRIRLMAKYINKNTSILDLGCGEEWLKEYLPSGTIYMGCDYKKRSTETIVCDFNKKQFPKIDVDTCFVSGCLEYIHDYNWFINKIGDISHNCIISYCSIDFFPDSNYRNKHNWVNSLSEKDIIKLFSKNGFYLQDQIYTETMNSIFYFVK